MAVPNGVSTWITVVDGSGGERPSLIYGQATPIVETAPLEPRPDPNPDSSVPDGWYRKPLDNLWRRRGAVPETMH